MDGPTLRASARNPVDIFQLNFMQLKKHYKGTVCKNLRKIYQIVFVQKFKKYLETETH